MALILFAEVGGTNARFSLYDSKKEEITCKKTFPTQKYTDASLLITDVVNSCIDVCKVYPKKAFISIAGLVDKNKAIMTNSKLKFFKHELIEKTVLEEIYFYNDLEAQAYAIASIKSEELSYINKKKLQEKKPKVLISIGTGFGASILYFNEEKKEYSPLKSESGHVDFAAKTKEEFELIQFLLNKEKLKNISYETLVSGPGLERIYSFLARNQEKYPKTLAIETFDEKETTNPLVKKSYSLFFRFLARAAKNLGLETLSFGGIYFYGGILRHSKKFIVKKHFIDEFSNSNHFQQELKKIPISIISKKELAFQGLEYLYQQQKNKKLLS